MTRLLIPRGQVPLQGSILQLRLDLRACLQESHKTGDPSFLRRHVLREVEQGGRPLESTHGGVSFPASLYPLQGELPSRECPPQCTSSPPKHSPDFSLGVGLLTPSETASVGHVIRVSAPFRSRSLLRMLRSQLTAAHAGSCYRPDQGDTVESLQSAQTSTLLRTFLTSSAVRGRFSSRPATGSPTPLHVAMPSTLWTVTLIQASS
jgi:hypothetical protein